MTVESKSSENAHVSVSHITQVPVYHEYAIFQQGGAMQAGKQYQAIVGKTVEVDLIDAEVGDKVTFAEVLLVKRGEKGLQIGRPFVDTKVTATVVKHMRGPKLIVFKFKRRKKSRVKNGHRQSMTIVRIDSF